MCHKALEDGGAHDDDVQDDERDEVAQSQQDWCIVIHRENDDLVLTRREFRRDAP